MRFLGKNAKSDPKPPNFGFFCKVKFYTLFYTKKGSCKEKCKACKERVRKFSLHGLTCLIVVSIGSYGDRAKKRVRNFLTRLTVVNKGLSPILGFRVRKICHEREKSFLTRPHTHPVSLCVARVYPY